MIEIVAGDRVPDLPFVIVNREGCHVDLTGITPADRGGEHVGDEEADRLRLLIVVGACGAFVAVPRNHAEIVLAHAHRQSPNSLGMGRSCSAARPMWCPARV